MGRRSFHERSRVITTTTSWFARIASVSRAAPVTSRRIQSNPPADPENPRWENLASAIGNQYINEGKVFACNVEKGGFFYEMLAAQPRGTSDTSRIATDHINNPNAINPIFLLAERERIAVPEKMAGGTLALPGEREEMPVPHILKDGADSIGVAGRNHSRLCQHRHVFRVLADAPQPIDRADSTKTV